MVQNLFLELHDFFFARERYKRTEMKPTLVPPMCRALQQVRIRSSQPGPANNICVLLATAALDLQTQM